MTLRNTPLWGRTAGVLEVICPTREVKYFRCGDWTGKFAKAVLICPSGWIASLSRTEPIAPAHANRQNRTAGISEITPRNRTCCGHAKIDANDPLADLLLFASDVRFQILSRPNPLAVMILRCAARNGGAVSSRRGKLAAGLPRFLQIPQASRRALGTRPESACLSCRHAEIASLP
jgi:hypothetical protein